MPGYIRNIKLLHWIIKCGSIQKAADHVGLTRQAASQVILNMEAEYGFDIIKRSSNKIQVTTKGLELDNALYKFVLEASHIQQKEFIELVVVSSHFIIYNVVCRAAKLIRNNTKAELILIGDDNQTNDALSGCDIYIGPTSLLRTDIEKIPFPYVNVYRFYAAPSYIEKTGTPNSFEDLIEHDLIIYGGGSSTVEGLSKAYLNQLIGSEKVLRTSLRVNSVEGMISLAQQGIGMVALTPLQALKAPDLVPVLNEIEAEEGPFFIQYSRKAHKKVMIEKCVEILLEVIKDISSESVTVQ